ncbi:MAG: hypothetical protein GXP37_15465 [Chloroflexi bacterium]|nr:hypothetical protein [Chloroflexota bacterium]
MNAPYISISVITLAVLGLLVLVVAIRRNRGEQHEPNYRVFFTLGIIWLPIGIATDNPGLWGMGAVFLIIGLANRNKWKKERGWSDLTDNERRFKVALIGGLLALALLSLVAYYLLSSGTFGG